MARRKVNQDRAPVTSIEESHEPELETVDDTGLEGLDQAEAEAEQQQNYEAPPAEEPEAPRARGSTSYREHPKFAKFRR